MLSGSVVRFATPVCRACNSTGCRGAGAGNEANCSHPLTLKIREQEERIRKLEDYVLGLQDVFVHAKSVGEGANKTE